MSKLNEFATEVGKDIKSLRNKTKILDGELQSELKQVVDKADSQVVFEVTFGQFNLTGRAFTTNKGNQNVVQNKGTGQWNQQQNTNEYTVNDPGTYLCIATTRFQDNTGQRNWYINIGTQNTEENSGVWTTNSGMRYTAQFNRIAQFNKGDRIRLYYYNDATDSVRVDSAQMSLFKLPETGGGALNISVGGTHQSVDVTDIPDSYKKIIENYGTQIEDLKAKLEASSDSNSGNSVNKKPFGEVRFDISHINTNPNTDVSTWQLQYSPVGSNLSQMQDIYDDIQVAGIKRDRVQNQKNQWRFEVPNANTQQVNDLNLKIYHQRDHVKINDFYYKHGQDKHYSVPALSANMDLLNYNALSTTELWYNLTRIHYGVNYQNGIQFIKRAKTEYQVINGPHLGVRPIPYYNPSNKSIQLYSATGQQSITDRIMIFQQSDGQKTDIREATASAWNSAINLGTNTIVNWGTPTVKCSYIDKIENGKVHMKSYDISVDFNNLKTQFRPYIFNDYIMPCFRPVKTSWQLFNFAWLGSTEQPIDNLNDFIWFCNQDNALNHFRTYTGASSPIWNTSNGKLHTRSRVVTGLKTPANAQFNLPAGYGTYAQFIYAMIMGRDQKTQMTTQLNCLTTTYTKWDIVSVLGGCKASEIKDRVNNQGKPLHVIGVTCEASTNVIFQKPEGGTLQMGQTILLNQLKQDGTTTLTDADQKRIFNEHKYIQHLTIHRIPEYEEQLDSDDWYQVEMITLPEAFRIWKIIVDKIK